MTSTGVQAVQFGLRVAGIGLIDARAYRWLPRTYRDDGGHPSTKTRILNTGAGVCLSAVYRLI